MKVENDDILAVTFMQEGDAGCEVDTHLCMRWSFAWKGLYVDFSCVHKCKSSPGILGPADGSWESIEITTCDGADAWSHWVADSHAAIYWAIMIIDREDNMVQIRRSNLSVALYVVSQNLCITRWVNYKTVGRITDMLHIYIFWQLDISASGWCINFLIKIISGWHSASLMWEYYHFRNNECMAIASCKYLLKIQIMT